VVKLLHRNASRRQLIAFGVVLALATAALGVIAYHAMFSSFDVPDDDGYLLMSLRKFDAGGSLYTQVYSQYGPGMYALVGGALHIVGLALTSDGARMYNLFLWLASTLLVGLVLLRLTRSFFVSGAGLLVAFLVLKVDANEPMHPGATIGFLLILLVALAVFLIESRERTGMALVGATAAALLSIKVNVGAFAFASIAVACTVAVPALRERTWLRVGVAAIFVAIPIALISGHLDQDWAQRFAGLVAIGGFSLVLVSTGIPSGTVPGMRGVSWLALGALATIAFVCLVPILGGTTPSDLARGWLIRPSDTPSIQYAPLFIDPRAWWWAFAGWVAALAALWSSERSFGPRVHLLSGAARIAVGLLIWASLVSSIFDLPPELTQSLVIGAPLLWLAALPPTGAPFRNTFLRVLIPALAALQFLHAYPMPGSQLAWGSLLLVLVAAICVSDGIGEITTAGAAWRPTFEWWRPLATVVVVAFSLWIGLKPLRKEARDARAAYNSGVSLALPGATKMRVSEPLYLQMHSLVRALQAHCDTFLTLPGMNSLNIFAHEEPPTEMSGPWPFFFTAGQQRKIVMEVAHQPRLCIVRKPDLLAFWAGFSGSTVPKRPLVNFIESRFALLHDFSGYQLLVKQ
jgi:hypothetical protein